MFRRSLSLFAVVGAMGFIIDAGILTYLNAHVGMDIYAARCASFSAASAATWWLNRSITFNARAVRDKRVGEYVRYVVVQIGGALINMCIFVIAVWHLPSLARWPVLPLAIGATGGLLFNYVLSRAWVFRQG